MGTTEQGADDYAKLRHQLNNSLLYLINLPALCEPRNFKDPALQLVEREGKESLDILERSHLSKPEYRLRFMSLVEGKLGRMAPWLGTLERKAAGSTDPLVSKHIQGAAKSHYLSLELIRKFRESQQK